MRTVKLSALILALAAGACGEQDRAQGANFGLSQADDDAPSDESAGPAVQVVGSGDVGDFLECANGGGSVGMIHVVFDCDSVTIYSCKDLSNVVLELENGERQRFEGLNGQVGTFSVANGRSIAGVWVKAGNNKSGDGPGYGERFDAPEQDCDPPGEAGTGGTTGGGGGNGGTGGTCGSNDPDEPCAGNGGIGGGGNGGEPICSEGSLDPRCNVE